MKFKNFLVSERERLPLFIPVILGMGIIFGVFFPFSDWKHVWIFNTITIFCTILLFKKSKLLSFAICIFGLGIYIVQTGGILKIDLLTQKKFITQEYDNIEFTAVVSSMDETHPIMKNMRRVTLEDTKIENLNFIKTIKMTCSARMSDEIFPGDIVKIRGKLMPFKLPAIPGVFDQLQYNTLVGIDASGIAYRIEKTGEANAFDIKLAKIRCGLTKNILRRMSGNDIAGGIAIALITGDKSAIPSEVRDKFINSGTAHILAISGLHMSIAF